MVSAGVNEFRVEFIYFSVAMILSFLGDLAMANKLKIVESRIINGIGLFGLGHIFYGLGFWTLSNDDFKDKLIFALVILIFVFYFVIGYNRKQPRAMNIATLFYTVLISSVVILATNFSINSDTNSTIAAIAIIGIILFVISDSLIAVNNFKQKIPGGDYLIAGTYIPAQLLLQSILLFH